jgi:succinate dehydrogenase / fumarate reductase cytochrome b subunit
MKSDRYTGGSMAMAAPRRGEDCSMSEPNRLIGTSVGRKVIMAVSGLLLCAFLLVHLIGNLTLLLRDDGSLTADPAAPGAREHFIGVISSYGAIPALLYAAELALAALFLVHIVTGTSLWLQNRRARGPQRYRLQRWEGGRSLGSATMPISGLFVILVFLIIHLVQFRFGPQDGPAELAALVDARLSWWPWALAYGAALVGLMIHLSHGVQSAFQSLGLRHPRWTPWLQRAGWAYALLMLAGFGVLPLLFVLQEVMA